MSEPVFFKPACHPTIADLIAWTGAKIWTANTSGESADLTRQVHNVVPLDQGRDGDLVFLDNPKYATSLAKTKATACFLAQRYANQLPSQTIALISPEPYRAIGIVLQKMFPAAVRPGSFFGTTGVAPGAFVHPEARLEEDVTVDPGAIIGPGAEIGSGSVIGPYCVIGPEVRIGRDCSLGAGATLTHALIGDRVIIHPGVKIGQDGFGFAMGPRGHLKMPQIGRVIIQNHVEIGANTTIDRGANRDTVIGEGTKIDNLVQIGHNVIIGRHCVIVSQVGISGSTEIGDFVAIGGQAGLAGHLRIGTGSQIGAQSGVMNDIPAGERWGGSPARPMRAYFRSIAALDRLAVSPASEKTKQEES